MKNLIKNHIIFTLLALFSISAFSQSKTVTELLNEVQTKMSTNNEYSCLLNYKLYPTYDYKTTTESYKGSVIKNNENYFLKINETVFLTDANTQTSLKLNIAQKAISVAKNKSNMTQDQSPLGMLDAMVKLFKNQDVKDNGTYWLCTLTSDVVTQLPYGKVEIFINKKDFRVTKQVLYFLARFPYKNAEGEKATGSPKLEITISDYRTSISKEQKGLTMLSNYIEIKNDNLNTIGSYKDFKIIKN
nr:hypothetical protein [uncultured Psychroserpens sp.]